jgi:hypothetical protein
MKLVCTSISGALNANVMFFSRQADFQKPWHCLTAVTRRIKIDIAPRYLSGVLRTEYDSVRP